MYRTVLESTLVQADFLSRLFLMACAFDVEGLHFNKANINLQKGERVLPVAFRWISVQPDIIMFHLRAKDFACISQTGSYTHLSDY